MKLPVRISEFNFQKLISRVVRSRRESTPLILLESQLPGHPASRKSILARSPARTIEAYGDQITVTVAGKARTFQDSPWQALAALRKEHPGWYVGYLGYDLKNYTEALQSRNRDPVGAPDLFFFQPEELLVMDHLTGMLSAPCGIGSELATLLAETINESDPGVEDGGIAPIQLHSFASTTPGEVYISRIQDAQHRIREGDFYEINLSHLLQGRFRGASFDLYRRMREEGPVPFGAYMAWNGWRVCSASPERFLCREGARLFSQPIKGTAPRMIDPEQDRRVREALLNSEKERAENLMIVDLVRHDLSKVALPGTVRVPELFSLHQFQTVHQLISTVEGRVDPEQDPVGILQACFPMGSMTGAPKIRAMQVIEELEDYRRGIYSGAIGYLDPSGDFDFNVVIRTAVLNGDQLFYPVGGAITSDSDPQDELEETWVKARALTRALHSV